MDQDEMTEGGTRPEVPLVPAAAIGFLLYPWVMRTILANPPANDPGNLAPAP